MESSNPTLNEKTFGAAQVGVGEPAMTLQGTINKTLVLLAIVMATALWTWSKTFETSSSVFLIGTGAFFVAMILGFVTVFRPQWSGITAPIYAACQGLFLGNYSAYFEMHYHLYGIAVQAVGLTFTVMLAMLLAYKTGWIQATPMFIRGLTIATIGIAIFYGIVMIASMFGIHQPGFLYQGTALGIGFSLFVVGIAALNLILDFNFIEQGSRQGLAKYMEWYGAFSLMVTLIWLYLEILRLLAKISRRN